MQKIGGKQKTVRNINLRCVFELLQDKDRSGVELAKLTGLSATSISKITRGLLQKGVLQKGEVLPLGNGRFPTKLKINPDAGYVIAIDFSVVQIHIIAADILGKKLKEFFVPHEKEITRQNIEAAVEAVKDIMQAVGYPKNALLCICIAVPGKFDKETYDFIYSPRFKNYREINIYQIFKQNFDAHIIIKNDMKIFLAAERAYGVLKNDRSDTFFLFIDEGTGSAFCYNDIITEGANGFTGEIGLMITNPLNSDTADPDLYNNARYFNDVFCTTALAESFRRKLMEKRDTGFNIKGNAICFSDIADNFKTGNAFCAAEIKSYSLALASFVGSIAELMDFNNIIISGMITELGDGLIALLQEYLNKRPSRLRVHVKFGNLTQNAKILGCVSEAVKVGLETLFLN